MTISDAVIYNGKWHRQMAAHFAAWFGKLQEITAEPGGEIVKCELVGPGKFSLKYCGREFVVRLEYTPAPSTSPVGHIVAYEVDRLDEGRPTFRETYRVKIDTYGSLETEDRGLQGGLAAVGKTLMARILLGSFEGLDRFSM